MENKSEAQVDIKVILQQQQQQQNNSTVWRRRWHGGLNVWWLDIDG